MENRDSRVATKRARARRSELSGSLIRGASAGAVAAGLLRVVPSGALTLASPLLLPLSAALLLAPCVLSRWSAAAAYFGALGLLWA